MTKLPEDVKAFARRLGGDLPPEENKALFLDRACKKLGCTEDHLRSLGFSEKMAVINLLSQSVIDANGN